MLFRVAWKSKLTGNTGWGEWLNWPKNKIDEFIKKLNEEYKDSILHWSEQKEKE